MPAVNDVESYLRYMARPSVARAIRNVATLYGRDHQEAKLRQGLVELCGDDSGAIEAAMVRAREILWPAMYPDYDPFKGVLS